MCRNRSWHWGVGVGQPIRATRIPHWGYASKVLSSCHCRALDGSWWPGLKLACLLAPVGQQSWVEYKMLAYLYQEAGDRQRAEWAGISSMHFTDAELPAALSTYKGADGRLRARPLPCQGLGGPIEHSKAGQHKLTLEPEHCSTSLTPSLMNHFQPRSVLVTVRGAETAPRRGRGGAGRGSV